MSKNKKSGKSLGSFKRGFTDMKTALQEGSYKLFIKQVIVIVAIGMGYRYAMDIFDKQNSAIFTDIESVQAQQNNEKEYLSNKKKLLELEPRFPDMNEKNDWLLRQVVAVFKEAKITPTIGAAQAETTGNGYTATSLPVDLSISYDEFGQLMATIENKDELLRVSSFTLDKRVDEIGSNTIKMQINTVFPKEKIAQTMFKNEAKKEAKK